MLALQPSLCSVSTPRFLTLQRPHSAVSYVSLVSSASTSWLAHARLPDRNAKLESDFEVTIYKGVYRRRPWPVHLLGHGDARVRSVGAVGRDDAVGHAIDGAVEGDLVVLVNELAGVDALPERDKDVLGALDVVLAKTSLERLGGLPGVVVGDLARDVVEHVGLGDAVEEVGTNGAEPVAVNGAEGATREGPGLGLVVGEGGVGVLEVGDHDEPVVAEEVGDNIVAEHVGETALGKHAPGSERAESSSDADVRDDDLRAVTLVKDDGVGVEVVGVLGVVELAGGVPEEVEGPAEELLNKDVGEVVERSILEDLGEPLAPSLVNVDGTDLLLDSVLVVRVVARLGGGLQRKAVALRSGAGNKDLVTGKVAGGGVVTGVRDAPRVVGHEESRVEHPADGVVERLAGAEALVAALVGNDPNASEDHALEDPVDGPGGEAGDGLLDAEGNVGGQGVGLETREGGCHGGVNVGGGKAESSDHGKVGKDIGEGLEGRALEAVGGDSGEQVLDGEVGHLKGGNLLLVVGSCLAVRVSHVLDLGGLVDGGRGGLLASALTSSGDVSSHCRRHGCKS
ncbi:hypothetical protein L1887_57149 [Cichorium endivia]|nr:hypothetical protein L1887_57149 [Cichorium endivia]